MDIKKNCICCGKRLTGNGKRTVTMNSLRIFISARLYPAELPNEGFICDKCRWIYKKWVGKYSFCQMLLDINSLKEDSDMMNEEYVERNNGNSSNDRYVR
jgi:hypothetical protein